MSTVRVEIERKDIEGKTYAKEYHYVSIADLEKFLKEKVYVGDVFRIIPATTGTQLTAEGKPVQEIVGKKEWIRYQYGTSPGDFFTTSYVEMKAVGEKGEVVAQTSPPQLIVQQTVKNIPQPPEKPENLFADTKQPQISVATPTVYGQQTAIPGAKNLQETIVEQTKASYIPATELQRIIEHERAMQGYWRHKILEDPEKAHKEYQEYLAKQQTEEFRKSLISSSALSFGIGLIFPPQALAPLGIASIGYITNKIVSAYNQPKDVIIPEMKKIGDEIQFSYRVEKTGKMGVEGVKQYLSQPQVLGGLIGGVAGSTMAMALRPQYELDIQLPRKIKVETKTLVQGDKAISISQFYGKSKDVYVVGYEIQRSQLINAIDKNKVLRTEFLGDKSFHRLGFYIGKISKIKSESFSRTIVYSPFYGKSWEIYGYRGPIFSETHQTLVGQLSVFKRNIELSKMEMDNVIAFLGKRPIGEGSTFRIGGIETDVAKVNYYAFVGRGKEITLYGTQKVITPKEATLPQTQLGSRAMDIPYESLPTDWKISLAMKTMFGEPKTQPQLQIQTMPQITLTKQPISVQTITPIVIAQTAKQGTKNIPTQGIFSTKIKLVSKEKEKIVSVHPTVPGVMEIKLSDISSKMRIGMTPFEKINTRINTGIKQEIGVKIDSKLKQEVEQKITQRQTEVKISTTFPTIPNISLRTFTIPSIQKISLGKTPKYSSVKEDRITKSLKTIEKYKPSLFAISKGLKGVKMGEFGKAYFRPMFKLPKIKVKI